MEWTALPVGLARLKVAKSVGFSLDIGTATFAPTWDADALGALCFAYGLDNQLFGTRTVEKSGFMYLSWHFCALVSRQLEDPGLEGMTWRALDEALKLAPTEDVARDVRKRFDARHTLVVKAAREPAGGDGARSADGEAEAP